MYNWSNLWGKCAGQTNQLKARVKGPKQRIKGKTANNTPCLEHFAKCGKGTFKSLNVLFFLMLEWSTVNNTISLFFSVEFYVLIEKKKLLWNEINVIFIVNIYTLRSYSCTHVDAEISSERCFCICFKTLKKNHIFSNFILFFR